MRGLSVGIIEALRKTFGVLDGSKGDGTGTILLIQLILSLALS